MYQRHSSEGHLPALPGITRKTLVYGASTLMTEFRLARGSSLPRHAHPHEQTGYLVAGHLRLRIGAEEHDVRPGDSWCIPGDIAHDAEALEESVAIEVFAPVRNDYLPQS